VRVALAATRQGVAALVIRQGLYMTAIAIAIGLSAAALLTRYIVSVPQGDAQQRLYGVRPGDPLTYAIAAGAPPPWIRWSRCGVSDRPLR